MVNNALCILGLVFSLVFQFEIVDIHHAFGASGEVVSVGAGSSHDDDVFGFACERAVIEIDSEFGPIRNRLRGAYLAVGDYSAVSVRVEECPFVGSVDVVRLVPVREADEYLVYVRFAFCGRRAAACMGDGSRCCFVPAFEGFRARVPRAAERRLYRWCPYSYLCFHR